MKAQLILSAAALVMSSGLAVAQQTSCCNKTQVQVQAQTQHQRTDAKEAGGFIVTGFVPDAQPEVHSKIVMVQNEDDHEYKVEIEDDNVHAWVDGEKVSAKHLKIDNDKIRILDADGETIAEFARGRQMMPSFRGTAPPVRSRRMHENRDNDGPIVWHSEDDDEGHAPMMRMQMKPTQHPPVMLGIQMGPIDEDTADELDIDTEDGIQVMQVLDGLPADKAGLRKDDIILKVDGHKSASPAMLGDLLKNKKPGEKLKLRINRDGKEKTITLKLAPWDSEALGIGEQQMQMLQLGNGSGDRDIQELLERIQKLQGDDSKGAQKKMEKLLNEFSKTHQNAYQYRNLDELPRMRSFRGGEGGSERAPRMLIEPNSRSNRAMREFGQQIDELDRRFDRMEDRLDRIIKLLEENEEQDDD